MSQLGAGARGRPGAAAWSRARLWGSAAAPASACPIPLLSADQRAEDSVQRISSIPWGWCGCMGTEPVFCYVEATAEMPGPLLWGQASQRVSLVPGPRPGGPLGAALPAGRMNLQDRLSPLLLGTLPWLFTGPAHPGGSGMWSE